MSEKKATQNSTKSTSATAKNSKGFTHDKRAAMKERAKELKAQASRGPRAQKAGGESGTQTMIDLAYALAFALLMLVPISDPAVLGGVLLLLSLGGALDSLRTIARHRWLHGWTHYVSLGCFAVFPEILMIYHAIVQAYGSPRRCAR